MRDIEHKAELELGSVVLECRQRRRFVVFLDLGGSWIQVILTPLVTAVFLAIATFALCQHLDAPRLLTVQAMVFVLVATAIIVYVLYFTAPETISLAMHERGFRYKAQLIPFAELAKIRVGKVESGFANAIHGLNQLIGTFHRGARMAATITENSNRATLTVSFKDRRTLFMKNAMIEYQEKDLDKFFGIIREQFPELLNHERVVCEDPLPEVENAPARCAEPASVNSALMNLAANTREGIDPTCGNVTARDAVSEFARGNYRPASLLLGATNDPKLREFYVRALREWTGRPYAFEVWKREEPANPNVWLVSGAHLIDWAWQARGRDQADKVDQQAWATYAERLKQAESELVRAGGLNMEDATPHAFLLRVAIGLNWSREAALKVFDQAVRRCPDHFLAHSDLLTYFCEKWHGSHEEMFEFAHAASDKAPAGSLLPTLIAQAHTERWLYATSFDGDPHGDQYFQRPEVRDCDPLGLHTFTRLAAPCIEPTESLRRQLFRLHTRTLRQPRCRPSGV